MKIEKKRERKVSNKKSCSEKIIKEPEEDTVDNEIPKEFRKDYVLINKKVIVPSDEELSNNNRSRSAKLRIIERKKE